MKDFSNITKLLTWLTKKKVKYEWLDKLGIKFQNIKCYLTSTLVLTSPIISSGFMVYYNALIIEMNCVLMQYNKVITYASRHLKNHE